MPGKAVTIGVGSHNDVWVTNNGHQIYHCHGDGNWVQKDGAARQIAAGHDGTVVCINSNEQIYKRNGEHGQWEELDGRAVQASVWDHHAFAVVNSGGEIYARRDGQWVREEGNAQHVSVGGDHYRHVTCTNSGHQIYRHGYHH